MIQLGVTGPDLIPCPIKHSHPVSDELPLAGSAVIELTGEGG